MATLNSISVCLAAAASSILSAAAASAAPPPPPDALTEFSASMWSAGATGGTASVANETTLVREGSASIRFVTNGGFDTWLTAPATKDAHWNLMAAGSGGVSFWVRAQNENIGFQNNSPWIRLHTAQNHYIELHATTEILNAAIGQWIQVNAPLAGDALWQVSTVGAPDLTNINWIEIHADTWGSGFTLWIDGLAFDAVPGPPATPYLVTPVLFIPDPASYPVGYAPTEAEIAEDLVNIDHAMGRIREWYAESLGLGTSLKVLPVTKMPAYGGLGSYDIVWSNPALRYTTGIELGNTWGKVTAEVSARGYGPGTVAQPKLTVIFCKGAGGFAGGAQWHGATGGGMCMLGDWCLDSLAERVPQQWHTWWTGVDLQTGATAHELGHSLGLPHPDAVNPVSGQQDWPYTVMGHWWNWPTFAANPADPSWGLTGLHGWAINAGASATPAYMDQFLLSQRASWFATPLPITGDLNADGIVNGVDLAILLGSWGPCAGCVADINGDGTVNGGDLAVLLGNWG